MCVRVCVCACDACTCVCVRVQCSCHVASSKWTLLWNVFSILCPLSTPLKQSSAKWRRRRRWRWRCCCCYCGCEPRHQCWPHLPTLHTLRSPSATVYCPTVSLLCTCGCGDRPSDTARRYVGWGASLLLLLGVGQCFLFRLPYAYFNFRCSLRVHAPRAPNFHVTPFPWNVFSYDFDKMCVCVCARVCVCGVWMI